MSKMAFKKVNFDISCTKILVIVYKYNHCSVFVVILKVILKVRSAKSKAKHCRFWESVMCRGF